MEAMKKTTSITVQDVPVTIMNVDQRDYISLTDMAKARTDAGRAADVIKNWLRARSTLEFLGTWEVMYNPNFKVVEFDHFKSEAGLHTFTLSAKEWIEKQMQSVSMCRQGATAEPMPIKILHLSSAPQSVRYSNFIC